ncbi:MAG: response regulator, partial [Paenibacillaceae bacterium]|nr:response regulator [Paenibacillaceae bacterium]
MAIRIVVIDDEVLVRKGIISSIDWSAHGIEVAGEATDGISGMELIRTTLPHIVLTDIKMPRMDGLELIRALRSEYPSVKILILTVLEDFPTALEALRLGVSDYIQKLMMTPDELLQTVVKIAAGLPPGHRGEKLLQTHDEGPGKEGEAAASESDYTGFFDNSFVAGFQERESVRLVESGEPFLRPAPMKNYLAMLDLDEEQVSQQAFEQLFPRQIERPTSVQNVKDGVCQWVSSVMLYIRDRGGHLESAFQGDSPFEQIHRLDSYDTLIEWCLRLHQVVRSMAGALKHTHRVEINKAIDYIDTHYMDNIRVKDIARWVHLSENYFSNLFAKEKGVPFSQYLQEVRVRQARELLEKGNMFWIEAGEKVGYENPKYFAKMFKRYYGLTPLQFA